MTHVNNINAKKKLSILAVVLGSAALSGTAYADNIVVGVEELNYFPHYTMDGGEYGGFGRALFDAWAADRGHTVEYRAFPIKRLFENLVEGKIDMKYPDNAYWSSDMKDGKSVVYSEKVVEYIDGVSVKPGNVGKGMDSVKKLGTVRGFTAWSWLDVINSGTVKVSENKALEGVIKQTLADRVDAAYANVSVIQYQLDKMGSAKALTFDPDLKHTRDFYYASTTTKPQLISDFNSWMADNAAKVDALKAEYKVTLD
ncbi:ABC transporter substrate-binding protein [Labrenzia sp. PHM005]|uniref:substrate-binding periplasmic protein n=1 Tax=Labrenzia sp. PHM005 TaxID=2590016 RepID=UPI001140120C|nr:transporter substrate-binding domain-containing protein [Labrenzia sp. PHM005]QDG77519.1 amino acid ABC transporter substrate-binding protein [Labrenzia sp. PHM005]